MFFITNRALIKSDNKITFDLTKNSSNNEIFFCKKDRDNIKEIGCENFIKLIRDSKYKQILFYIHGFSCQPFADIFPTAKKLQSEFDKREKDLVQIVPIIWPCDNYFGVIKDYWDDQKSADYSAISFARALQKLTEWQSKNPICIKRINILAHSMGNRVLKNTLNAWCKYYLLGQMPLIFRNIFMVAADIKNDSLEHNKSGTIIAKSARNVSVYHAFDDLALRGSKISNLKNKIVSARLGHTGTINPNNIAKNIYQIDCDNINNSYDPPLGHSYFLNEDKEDNLLIDHMYKAIKTGRVTASKNRSFVIAPNA